MISAGLLQSEQTSLLQHTNTTVSAFVTLEHKTSHKGPFFEIEIYVSSES